MLDIILLSLDADNDDDEIFTNVMCLLAKITNDDQLHMKEFLEKLEDGHITKIFELFAKTNDYTTRSAGLLFICNILGEDDLWVEVKIACSVYNIFY